MENKVEKQDDGLDERENSADTWNFERAMVATTLNFIYTFKIMSQKTRYGFYN